MSTQEFSQTKTPKYAHLEYSVLHELDISISEYFMLDMIFRLSGNGQWFCNKKLENIAYDMNMSKRGVTVVRDRLIHSKLLIKGSGNRLRTSEKVQKMYFSDATDHAKDALFSKKMQKVHSKDAKNVAKTSVENNRRLTLDYRNSKNRGEGYKAAKAQAQRLKQKQLLS